MDRFVLGQTMREYYSLADWKNPLEKKETGHTISMLRVVAVSYVRLFFLFFQINTAARRIDLEIEK